MLTDSACDGVARDEVAHVGVKSFIITFPDGVVMGSRDGVGA